jgi:protocadherin Fat 4
MLMLSESSGHLVAPDCHESLQPISLGDGAFLEYRVSDKHRRMQLLESMYEGSTLWREEAVSGKSSRENAQSSSPTKSLTVVFKTVQADGMLVYTATNNDFTSLEVCMLLPSS